jgi:hypothetical protein
MENKIGGSKHSMVAPCCTITYGSPLKSYLEQGEV